jgi:uncharacterized protein (TIGR03437 family)
VTVSSVVNAASFAPTPLVAGSLATILGSNLAGTNVSVTFDGTPASLLYTGATQINLQVPATLVGKTSSSMVVTVDGNSSTPDTVSLAPASPAVFSGGVLNQDNSVNGPGHLANPGDILQIFATGIPSGAAVTAQIGNSAGLVPVYAGPAPGIPGVQQVNVAVPSGSTGGVAPLLLCAATGGQQYCSTGYTLAVQ